MQKLFLEDPFLKTDFFENGKTTPEELAWGSSILRKSQYPTLPPSFSLSLTNEKPISAMRRIQCSLVRYRELSRQGSGNYRVTLCIRKRRIMGSLLRNTHHYEEQPTWGQ